MPFTAAKSGTRSLTASLCAALALSFAAINAKAEEQASNDFLVQYDQARVMRIDEPATDIIVGNPSIAAVAIRGAKLLVVTGKTFGVTNVIVLNADGQVIVNRRLVVRADDQKIVVETFCGRAYAQTPFDDATSKASNSAGARDLATMGAQPLELSDPARLKLKTRKRQVAERPQASVPAADSARQHKPRNARERIRPILKPTRIERPARKLALVAAPSEIAKLARRATPAGGRDLVTIGAQPLELTDPARQMLKTRKRQVAERPQANAPAAYTAIQNKPRIASERIRKKRPARKLALVTAPSEIAKLARRATRKKAKLRTVRAKPVTAGGRAQLRRKARVKRLALRKATTRKIMIARRAASRRAATRRARRNRYALGAARNRQHQLRRSRLRRAYRGSVRRSWTRKAFAQERG